MIAELVYIILGLAILWLTLTIIWDAREHLAQMKILKRRAERYDRADGKG